MTRTWPNTRTSRATCSPWATVATPSERFTAAAPRAERLPCGTTAPRAVSPRAADSQYAPGPSPRCRALPSPLAGLHFPPSLDSGASRPPAREAASQARFAAIRRPPGRARALPLAACVPRAPSAAQGAPGCAPGGGSMSLRSTWCPGARDTRAHSPSRAPPGPQSPCGQGRDLRIHALRRARRSSQIEHISLPRPSRSGKITDSVTPLSRNSGLSRGTAAGSISIRVR